MLKSWLCPELRNPCNYKFVTIDVREAKIVDEALLYFLGNELLISHGNPELIKSNCEELLHDALSQGLSDIAGFISSELITPDWEKIQKHIIDNYLESEILPDDKESDENDKQKNQVKITRIGNFGESLAARLLIDFDGFWLPIYKLRYREKKNWSPRLTDLCLFKKESDYTIVCYGEVKTKTTNCDKKLGIKGYESLSKEILVTNPEILVFIKKILFETQQFEEAAFIKDIQYGKVRTIKQHNIFLIHEKSTWNEEILENLNLVDIDPKIENLTVRILLIDNLKDLIDNAYLTTGKAAKELLANG